MGRVASGRANLVVRLAPVHEFLVGKRLVIREGGAVLHQRDGALRLPSVRRASGSVARTGSKPDERHYSKNDSHSSLESGYAHRKVRKQRRLLARRA
jgi:hypothetical protein